MNTKNINLAYRIKMAENEEDKELLTRDIIQSFKKKHIPEGLYLAERNVFRKGFDDARHIFLTNIVNKKPKYVASRELDNGQYATTFSMNSGMFMGLPLKGNFLTINGRSGRRFFDDTDLDCVNDLVTKFDDPSRDMKPTLYPITTDKRRRYALAKKLKNIIESNGERRLGDYQLIDIPGIARKNNCISITGGLMARVGITPEDLPDKLGRMAGIEDKDIYKYKDVIPVKENTKTAGVLDLFKKKPEQQDVQKKKTEDKPSILGLFSKKSPEEKLKEELERRIIENNPELWNETHEKDEYPHKDRRGNMISAIGTGLGALYGTGRGIVKSKTDPNYGTPQIALSGLGFGAVGFGLATTRDLLARSAGYLAGKYAKPRTIEQQKEYDSKRQIYSSIPGFDQYNAQMRKRVKKQQEEQNNNNLES